jgi:opacity protein-like surface antigen
MKLQIRGLMLTLAILGGATAALAQESQEPEKPLVLRDANDPSRFNESHVWLGLWTPSARSDFWDDNFKNFKASRGSVAGFAFGGDYIHHLDRHNALLLSSGFTLSSKSEPARNMTDESGNPLEHHLNFDLFTLAAGYVLYPAGTDSPVIPYLGAGVGLYAGELRSYRSSFTTDDCDENGENCTTEYTESKDSSFATFGYFALAGLEVPVTPGMALLLDGRYTVAHAHLGGNFADNNHLDLSGLQLTAGVALRF